MASRILLVDDDPDILMTVGLRLRTEGFDVTTAPDGGEAVKLAETHEFDLILLDVMMPEENGFDTCARLQLFPKTAYVPIIFLTALGSEQDKATAFSLGAVDYIVKPMEEEELLGKVKTHMHTRHLWKDLHRETIVVKGRRRPSAFSEFKQFLEARLRLSSEGKARLTAAMVREIYAVSRDLGITDRQMAEHMAQFLELDYVGLVNPDNVQLGVLPTAFCRANQVVVTNGGDAKQVLVMSNPFDRGLLDLVESHVGKPSTLAVTDPQNIVSLCEGSFPATMAEIEGRLQETYEGEDEAVRLAADGKEDSAPVVMLVDRLIETAYEMGASDIHIEPMENDVVVRYRIDGELRIKQRISPRGLIRRIVACIKTMSKLDIAEQRLPQDGRIAFKLFSKKGLPFDLRVATSPSSFGEKVVLRILDKQRAILPLDELGFSARDLAVYRRVVQTPYGMVLHVGPTGSGKSLALYAALNEIRRPGINVQTAEDPIEYTLPGITQLQINPAIGLTFKQALRSFLRQDPDVILVGEIRDRETADIAIEAALTGHLVLSTMHTNDAASTVMRFTEMGIEPHMISSTLILACAQRLLRRLCTACRESCAPPEEERRLIGALPDADVTIYRAKQCDQCDGIGYRGRIGVYELFVLDDEMREDMNSKGITSEVLKRKAVERCGMTTLWWGGMEKVRDGITSLEEVLERVRQDEFDSRPGWMSNE